MGEAGEVMPEVESDKGKLLVPPSVTALREAGSVHAAHGRMARTISSDIREEREDLKEAAEQTSNVILDLSLSGIIRWVSPSWQEVIGTTSDSVKGKPIADLLIEDKDAFTKAVESIKKDDSKSHLVKFPIHVGPLSRYAKEESADEEATTEQDSEDEFEHSSEPHTIILEGQGIMVYDRSSGGESHSMWMLRPAVKPREITIDLPELLVESLGVGADMLAQYLISLADEATAADPKHHAPPMPVLCRICERQIPPWWFEKHTELCLQEHRAEMDVQMAQEHLSDHRNAIVKVLDALEARNSRPTSGELSASPVAQPEYKGLSIGPQSTQSTGTSSGTASPATSTNRSRDPSATGLGHARARSFAVRRPLTRIVELLCDLCDTAMEINTPAIKETPDQVSGDFRTQSPQSESRLSQVLQWQSPSTNTLDQEYGLAALCTDTENVARAKVEAVLRHRRILEYSERIRCEFSDLVQDCIGKAVRKARKIAAGELSSSTDDEMTEGEAEEEFNEEEEPNAAVPGSTDTIFVGSFEGPYPMATSFRKASDPALHRLDRRQSSAAGSTRSSSPKESPTPRSHKGAISILGQGSHYKRSSMHFESDAGDSDSSLASSMVSGLRRIESPASEIALSRATSSRERHRKSLIMPGAASPRRQISPGRSQGPPSPLRITKPRFPQRLDGSNPSPVTSPPLSGTEFSSPVAQPFHHRRQSSATSTDWRIPPPSPRLASVNHPQARAVATSIKDFDIIKPISKGAFGSVYLSKKKSTGDYYAIKVLKKADMVSKNQVTNVKAERAIMMWQGQSEFVAKLYWTFSSKDNLYLVMEYLNGGDCASLIKILGGLPEDWAKKYLAEVVQGVEHLHDRGIVHRDLKPDNLLIDQKGHLKLTDFGLSRMGLIGRQKRILSSESESAPDLIKSQSLGRAMSVASSRSASFDFQGYNSPMTTPQMTPDMSGSLGQPSYFSLNRESSLSRDSRRASGYRSDSGGSETLNAMFNGFSLNESAGLAALQRRQTDEDARSDNGGSPDIHGLKPVTSNPSNQPQSTPPQNSMMPPPMALFDPEDSNRRFVGTPDYLAPETINGVGQDEMSDWWSLGCILFEFLYGYPPFHADTPDQVFENILQRRIHWPTDDETQISPEAKELMNKLMTVNTRERLGANEGEQYSCGGEEVRVQPWFRGVNWDTLLEDEAQFVPAPEHPEDTEYFDARGATLQSFAEELEDQISPVSTTSGADYPDRPHDALSRVRSQVNSLKRNLMPLHIPAHVRDGRNRRLSEPVSGDDFGNFAFKNLPVLEKANKDVIQKLRAEAMQAQLKNNMTASSPIASSPSGQSLESSPIFPPLKRQMSISKAGVRPGSPSTISQTNSSPIRPSNPSSPLLLSHPGIPISEKRKSSSNSSSSLSHQSSNSLQPGNFFETPRLPNSIKPGSTASSPVKTVKGPIVTPASPQKGLNANRQSNTPTSRARSHTVGSQDGEPAIKDVFASKRRSGIFDISPSSSDNEDARANALLRVQRRRQSSRRMSQINLNDGPIFRPLDVLICEDHPVSRMVMERLLEKLRCRTISVSDGSEAMRYAMSEVKFDIILMEFKLPQINGADVARMIRDTRNANSHTPIVAVTGYLKELQDPHHFDELIEKPPTTSKLTDVLCRLCQWKAPPPGPPTSFVSTMPPSGLRQESVRSDDSPISVSSGYARMPGSTFRGSSRGDSVGSSFFGDTDSMNEDVPVIINRQPTDEWFGGGLGISDDHSLDIKAMPQLLTHRSAPPTMPKSQTRKKSAEKLDPKRISLEKKRLGQETADMGDDEDEELGDVQVRAKSPQRTKGSRGSKLGIEMMRTNSRGSVISTSDMQLQEGDTLVPPTIVENPAEKHTASTPPEIFPREVSDKVEEIDMDATPRPSGMTSPWEEAATPKPVSVINLSRSNEQL